MTTPWLASCDAERVLGHTNASSLDALVFSDANAAGSATPMTQLAATYCVDTSGSTSGAIMAAQIKSATPLSRVVPVARVYGWGSSAASVSSIANLTSNGGGTCPQSLVPHLQRDGVSLLVLYTDGEVTVRDMELFRDGMKLLPVMPVIVVLTLGTQFSDVNCVGDLKRQVNMSVPEAALSIASHALVLLNFAKVPSAAADEAPPHRVLMSSGEFARHFPALTLEEATPLGELRKFQFSWLSVLSLRALPPGCVQLPSVPKLVNLAKVFALARLPVDAWATLLHDAASVTLLGKLIGDLSARIMLPRIDTAAFHDLLVRVSRAAQADDRSRALADLRKRLAAIAVDPALKGGEQHRALLAEFNALKSPGAAATTTTAAASSASSPIDIVALRRLVDDALNAIAAYKADSTAIVLGSNRANRAAVATDDQLLEVGDCVQLPECPIFLQPGPACVLLRAPRESLAQVVAAAAPAPAPAAGGGGKDAPVAPAQQADGALLMIDGMSLPQYCSTDEHMENPFAFGTFLAQTITPGVFCQEFACEAAQNPLTRETVIGWIPLSRDPLVVLRHLGKTFCARRELWHLVRGWVAAVATHLARDQWAAHALMREHVLALCERYVTNDNLKGADDNVAKVPLLLAVQNVLRNFATCLRDRTESDIHAICLVSDVLQPEFDYDRVAVQALARLVQTFARMLAAFKRRDGDMLHVVLPVDDELGWSTGVVNKSLEGLIALLFFSTGEKYRLLRLQDAVDQAMLDPKLGKHLLHAFSTGTVLESAFDELVFREPATDNPHFGALPAAEKHAKWTAIGRDTTCCAYCGATFAALSADAPTLTRHIRDEFGEWFFSGTLFVNLAFEALGNNASEAALFRHAAARVQRHFGALDMRSHSVFVKERLLYFIRKMKALRA